MGQARARERRPTISADSWWAGGRHGGLVPPYNGRKGRRCRARRAQRAPPYVYVAGRSPAVTGTAWRRAENTGNADRAADGKASECTNSRTPFLADTAAEGRLDCQDSVSQRQGDRCEVAISRRQPAGDRLAVLPRIQRHANPHRLRDVSRAGVSPAQLGAQPHRAQEDRRAALDPRPSRSLRADSQAGPRGLPRQDPHHAGFRRSGRVDPPRFGPDPGGRHRLQEETAFERGPPGRPPRGRPLYRRRR